SRLLFDQSFISLRSPVAEELPRVAHLTDHIQVEVGNHERVSIARRLRDDLAARSAEIALPVKLADVPRGFITHAIDRADEVTMSHRVRRLFQFPQIL